jgi:hypothetical protein
MRPVLLVLIALAATPAWANDPPPTAPPRGGITTEELARTAEEIARQAGDVAKSVGGALGSLWNDVTTRITPAGPTDHLPGQMAEEDRQFFAILEAIGLKLKEVSVGKGLLASANYRFVADREPTDADIAKAEGLLRAYRDAQDGIRSRAKQRIARSMLDTVSTAGMSLAAMEVTLSPWPDASYQIVTKPKGG